MSSDFRVQMMPSRIVVASLNTRRPSVSATFCSEYAATIFIETIMNDGYIFEEIEAYRQDIQSFRGDVLVGRAGVATASTPVSRPSHDWTWHDEPPPWVRPSGMQRATEIAEYSRRYSSGAGHSAPARETHAFDAIFNSDLMRAFLAVRGWIMPPHGLPPLDSGATPEADAGVNAP